MAQRENATPETVRPSPIQRSAVGTSASGPTRATATTYGAQKKYGAIAARRPPETRTIAPRRATARALAICANTMNVAPASTITVAMSSPVPQPHRGQRVRAVVVVAEIGIHVLAPRKDHA